MRLQNRLALVTGGGRGIGRAIALAFAHEGARIVLAARTAEQVGRAADEIGAESGVAAMPVVCDVADIGSVQQMFASVTQELRRGPDILVNNAGIAESALLTKTDDELWQDRKSTRLNSSHVSI